jgi:hypothetical protein
MVKSLSVKNEKLIIANCSGFYGDRISAAAEMVRGGPIHFLTGDYLAELTMAILIRKRLKEPDGGYASTFLEQMEEVMGECLDKGIRVVSNAGGLNPKGLANELEKVAERLGLHPKIAYIEGDDLMNRLDDLQNIGETFTHMDKGISLKDANVQPITANAYLGGWGIVEALNRDADIVIGGRLADVAMVMGPSAWRFGWQKNDWDRLAGAAVAGHIIECSTQATGGNYSFMEEVPSFKNVGFPIAEIYEDGSSVITKHPGTGGIVSVGTVTSQLLYEIREPRYLTPDVAARFDTVEISQEGPDRVLITGVRGESVTDTTKVCINNLGGYRNSATVVLTGLDVQQKAKIMEETLFENLGGKEQFAAVDVHLTRSEKPDPVKNEEAFAYLRISVMDQDSEMVAKFSTKLIELAISNFPGFTLTAPPSKGTPAIQHWPTLVSSKYINQSVFVDGREFTVEPVEPETGAPVPSAKEIDIPKIPEGESIKVPLGNVFAARSGDKGGNANLGVWAKSPEAFAFLRKFLTTDRLKDLLPDMKEYLIERYELSNLLAINFYIRGILGDGVAASIRSDPQAKTLGEYLRAKFIELPESIISKR